MYENDQNRLFIAFLALSFVNNTQTMEPENVKKVGWVALAGAAIVGGYVAYQQFLSYVHGESTEAFPFAYLPPEMQHYIVKLLSVSSNATSVQEAGKTINALAQTNTELNELINDPAFCLKIIKNLAKQFGCSDQEAAEALNTQEAKKRLGIQKKFFNLCFRDDSDDEEFFNVLYERYKDYLDLNFTCYFFVNQKKVTRTYLMIAARNNNCPLINIFLKYGADINIVTTHTLSALMFAVNNECVDAVRCLVAHHHIAINQQTSSGLTACMLAVLKNNCPIIQILLDHGADINQADNDGLIPLVAAVGGKYIDVVRCLLKHPTVLINQQDKAGNTALMCAAERKGSCPIIKILINHGAKINQVNHEGWTPLMFAVAHQQLEAVQCLLEYPTVAVNHQTHKGHTALIFAVKKNNCPLIKILLEYGADINRATFAGGTALGIAAFFNQIEAVQCLLSYSNVAIDAQDEDGVTALMAAITQKNKVIIRLLLNAGANPELATVAGVTPLQATEKTGDKEIIDLIVNAIGEWVLKEVS